MANVKHKNKYSYDKFICNGAKISSIIICPLHGYFSQCMNNHVNMGKGCPSCGNELIRNIKTKSHDAFMKNCIEKYGDIYDLSKIKYINNRSLITPICRIHGIWKISAKQFLKGSNCPHCKMSSREKFIANILKENNISFDYQKKYPDCKNIFLLPFDFYIPHINTLIEYDGEQHFRPSWGKKGSKEVLQRFKHTKKLDNIKTKYAKKHNIKLIRIPYTLKDKEIKNIILGVFNANSI